MKRRVTVVKVGGSLFDWPDLGQSLPKWLDKQPGFIVLIAGGGTLADEVRRLDRLHNLGEEDCHWRCVEALSQTSVRLGQVLGMSPARDIGKLQQCLASPASGKCLFDPADWLRSDDASAATLPKDWSVTSDSLAARLAAVVGASEVVLLKSALPPSGATLVQAAENRYVDAYFPTAASELMRVRCVNLRSSGFPEITWRTEQAVVHP